MVVATTQNGKYTPLHANDMNSSNILEYVKIEFFTAPNLNILLFEEFMSLTPKGVYFPFCVVATTEDALP